VNMKIRAAPIAAALAAVLVAAPVAAGHVTLNPRESAAGSFAKFDVRVPNENESGDTTKIVMRFPEQVISASFQPVEGWQRTVKMARLDEPIEMEGERITEKIDTVTWSGGRIEPGEFQEFGVSFQVPEEQPGTELAFPAVQVYSGGEVVRWIGPPDADTPAPIVAVLEPAAEEGAAEEATPEPAPAQTSGGGEQDEGSDTLSIVALVVGIAALLAGLAALFLASRRQKAAVG
jgi:periplasmic copper chaperone A